MNTQLRIDFEKGRIIMSRTFAKLSENTSSEEYAHLQNVRRDYPTFTVERKRIKSSGSKESYKGLTYEYMERYIAAHDEDGTIMKEYRENRLLAECHSVRYPVIKAWFLEKYPEIKKYGVSADEETEDEAEQIIECENAELPKAG